MTKAYVIEELWTDSLENDPAAAKGYSPVAMTYNEEEAKRIVADAGNEEPGDWPILRPTPRKRYVTVDILVDEMEQAVKESPGPTQWAYDQACCALHKAEADLAALREELARTQKREDRLRVANAKTDMWVVERAERMAHYPESRILQELTAIRSAILSDDQPATGSHDDELGLTEEQVNSMARGEEPATEDTERCVWKRRRDYPDEFDTSCGDVGWNIPSTGLCGCGFPIQVQESDDA